MLERVKTNLGITGHYQDSTIQGYIDEVKEFLIDGGVHPSIANSDNAIGLISRGVADLWNYGSGGTDFSPYFLKRATQLAFKKSGGHDVGDLKERVETLESKVNAHDELFKALVGDENV